MKVKHGLLVVLAIGLASLALCLTLFLTEWQIRLMLHQDDFETSLANWQIINGVWYIEDGKLRGVSSSRGFILYNGEVEVDRYTISCDIFVISSDKYGTVAPEAQVFFKFNTIEPFNGYFAGIGAWGYQAGIGRYDEGYATRISEGGEPNYVDVEIGTWYHLDVEIDGDTITVFVDGEKVCSVFDNTYSTGQFGLTTIYSDVYYDNFKVSKTMF